MDYSLYKLLPIYKKTFQNESAVPILNKQDIVSNFPHDWLTPNIENEIKTGNVEWVSTSGTTSERMQIMRPLNWRAEQLTKTFDQHPLLKKFWDANMTRVSLTTAVCSQTACFKDDPGVEKRKIGNTLYINLSHDPHTWQKSDIERMLGEMKEYSPYFMDANPNYLSIFIKKVLQFNLLDAFVYPLAITFGYEFTNQNIQYYLTNEFNIPIINIYGSTELGYLLMENNCGNMLDCSEKTLFEYQEVDSENRLYDLIVSSDKNPYMPLIRYKTGDCVQMSDKDTNVVHRVCGRTKEILKTPQKIIPQAFFDDVIFQSSKNIPIYQLYAFKSTYKLHFTTLNDEPLCDQEFIKLSENLDNLLNAKCELIHRHSISPALSGKFTWLKVT